MSGGTKESVIGSKISQRNFQEIHSKIREKRIDKKVQKIQYLTLCYCSVTKLCPMLCDPMDCNTSGFPVLHYLLQFAQLVSIGSKMPSNHLILCWPLLLLPSIFPSIKVFSNESALCIRWPKYWSSSSSISSSTQYSGLISFRIDWLDLLAVQGTLKSLLQYQFESISSSVLSLLHDPTHRVPKKKKKKKKRRKKIKNLMK